ncbi:hypothetical protein PG996_000586 [Apiospora saccharicola]|uniref:Sulfotransferase family protein n=1 Tax=Apiospora saccharicola TaxID=335842 RepID=A0ABR1WE65_9PEZI
MKVLVLGLPRTGTQSLAEALEQLGISPIYHMREVGKNQHALLWTEAIETKFEGGVPWGCEEFDRILGEYEVSRGGVREKGLADYPAAIFPEELIEAYPEAAVILTVREDEQKWHDSMMSTLIPAHAQNDHRSSDMYRLAAKYHQHCWSNDFPTHGMALYQKHNQAVRDAAARRAKKLLEYKPGMGWAPLCEFLGLPTPAADVPYPRADDWLDFKQKRTEKA